MFEPVVQGICQKQKFDGPTVSARLTMCRDVEPQSEHVEKLANFYQCAPKVGHSRRAEDAYGTFRQECMLQYNVLVENTDLSVRLVDKAEPYESAKEMRAKVLNSGEIQIRSTRHFSDMRSGHALYPLARTGTGAYLYGADGNPLTYNDVFRTVHDCLTHVVAGKDTPFDLVGEYRATMMHKQMFSWVAEPALLNEAFAQICVHERSGGFPPQKMNAVPRSLIRKLNPFT
jgi:hypothetical protein